MFAISALNGPAASDSTMFTAERQIKKVQAAIEEQAQRAGMSVEQYRAMLPPQMVSEMRDAEMTIRRRKEQSLARSGGEFGGIDSSSMTPQQIANLRGMGIQI